MKYLYNWLKQVSNVKLFLEKSIKPLAVEVLEMDGVKEVGNDLNGVIVGQILDIQKHPNADKLQLTKVNIGDMELEIVCGARNINIGDKVLVATVGTKLPSGLEIKVAEIRGEKSSGMLCAEDELGLGTGHSGIMILDEKAMIGMAFAEYINLNK